MSQPSVANYFNTRKRAAIDDLKANSARKVLVLEESDIISDCINNQHVSDMTIFSSELNKRLKTAKVDNHLTTMTKKVARQVPHKKKIKPVLNQRDIQEFLTNMKPKVTTIDLPEDESLPNNSSVVNPEETHKTPPSTPTKQRNAMDKVNLTGKEMSINELKQKLSRSSRLAELKASIGRFKQSQVKLEAIEEKTKKLADSPSLKSFRTIEVEVSLSPTKPQSPVKQYLSPKKDTTARRNILNLLSPTKNAVSLPSVKPQVETSSPSLTLPFKYKYLVEIFRSIDTVSQILFNRKENITFRKLKPAVEEMLKRNVYEKHLAQIKSVYPDAFSFSQEKLRVYGLGVRRDQWELVVAPQVTENMSSDVLLERRRKFSNLLTEKVKHYHHEFLTSQIPPIHVGMNELKRWHPEFDLEKVPDIECAKLPQPPVEEKYNTGKDVLEKAKSMFNCNLRMEQALERLKQSQEDGQHVEKTVEVSSVLKGVPKAILDRVRQKQAAKALESMTRTVDKDKEVQLYARLAEIARLTRNLFVAEKKSVLHLDVVIDRLNHSFRTHMTKTDMEEHLRTISREVPSWVVFHEIRNTTFVKISKNSDLSLVMHKLDTLAKQKVAT